MFTQWRALQTQEETAPPRASKFQRQKTCLTKPIHPVMSLSNTHQVSTSPPQVTLCQETGKRNHSCNPKPTRILRLANPKLFTLLFSLQVHYRLCLSFLTTLLPKGLLSSVTLVGIVCPFSWHINVLNSSFSGIALPLLVHIFIN